MDFDDLVNSLKEEEKEVENKAAAIRQSKPSLNEEKLKALEASIESELSKVNLARKGCFGKLVRLIDSPVCQSCRDSKDCENELLTNGTEQMIRAETEVEEIVAENELNAELIELASAKPTAEEVADNPLLTKIDILSQINEVAEKAIDEVNASDSEKVKDQTKNPKEVKKAEEPEATERSEEKPKEFENAEEKLTEQPKEKPSEQPGEPKVVPSNFAEIDLSDLGKRTKVKFDFNAAKDAILTEKPTDFKRVRKICLSLVSDTYLYGSTAYANANKIMKKLQEMGICGWDAAKKQITYNI